VHGGFASTVYSVDSAIRKPSTHPHTSTIQSSSHTCLVLRDIGSRPWRAWSFSKALFQPYGYRASILASLRLLETAASAEYVHGKITWKNQATTQSTWEQKGKSQIGRRRNGLGEYSQREEAARYSTARLSEIGLLAAQSTPTLAQLQRGLWRGRNGPPYRRSCLRERRPVSWHHKRQRSGRSRASLKSRGAEAKGLGTRSRSMASCRQCPAHMSGGARFGVFDCLCCCLRTERTVLTNGRALG
jgi:hypothetical protein